MDGTRVTIKSEGVYILSGTCDDGMVIVDADKSAKIQIVCKNVTLHSQTSAAIYVKQADKVFLTLEAGTISVTGCYEGLEAQVVNISGGEVDIVSSDDGVNAAGGNDSSSKENSFGRRDMFDTDEDARVTISGGVLRVSAEGDGLDSNGYLTVSGGEIYVTGPTNSGNGSLDYGIEAEISGGLFVAAGSSLTLSDSSGKDLFT